MKKNKKIVKRKVVGVVTLNVYSSFNNTIVSASDQTGNVVAWASGGMFFKGTRKSTPFAAQSAVEDLSKKLKAMGVSSIKIAIKGLGAGRESILKGIQDFQVSEIIEKTPVRYNGTRLPKKRKG